MRRHLAYAAVAAVLALAGCGGDDPTPRVADPTPPASVSASPSASAAVEKEAWEMKTPGGAIAFAELWVSEFSTAFSTGDTATLVAMSEKSCTTCQSFIDLINEVYEAGGSIAGQPWKLTKPAWSAPDGADGQVAVSGTMRVPQQTIERSGESPSTAPATTQAYVFALGWRPGGWQVAKLLRDSQ